MPRTVLEEARQHPAIRDKIANLNADIVHNVQAAATSNPVLVVGMAGNPVVRRVRKALAGASIAYQYLEYGSYLGDWRRRTALKMWTGWPTFPMVFVKGIAARRREPRRPKAMIASGELKRTLGE